MTLIEFTIDGDSSATGSQTFTLAHTYTFRTLRLKHVIYHIANEKLYDSWPKATSGVTAPDRKMYAPLYLDVSGMGVQTYDHYYYASSSNSYNATGMVAIGYASDDTGTSDNTNKMTLLNLDLIKNEETTWTKDDMYRHAGGETRVGRDRWRLWPACRLRQHQLGRLLPHHRRV